jgi:hypothetical protein
METEDSVHHSKRSVTRTLSLARWIQTTISHNISLRLILILSFNPHLRFPWGHLSTCSQVKIMYAVLSSHSCYMLHPCHSSLNDYAVLPTLCHFLPFRYIYTPSINLKHPREYKIWASQNSNYKDYAVWSGRSLQKLRKNVLPPSSG